MVPRAPSLTVSVVVGVELHPAVAGDLAGAPVNPVPGTQLPSDSGAGAASASTEFVPEVALTQVQSSPAAGTGARKPVKFSIGRRG